MRRADEFLAALLRQRGWREVDEMAAVVAAWKEAVGETHAMHSRVADLQEETLVVEVDHAARLQLLQMDNRRILDRMAAVEGVRVSAVRYRVAHGESLRPKNDGAKRGQD